MRDENNVRILLIDDDEEFCQLTRDYLELQNMTLDYCTSGISGIQAIEKNTYDLILLDMMLPDEPGVEVLRQIRAVSSIPVIIFSAHNDETDRIVALELGADDYVPKSFSSRELLARVRAVLRRPSAKAEEEHTHVRSVGGLELTPRTHQVSFSGRPLELTYVEYSILQALMRAPRVIFPRKRLLNLFADKEWNKFDRSVDVHISTLRKKLADATGKTNYIRTVRSAGYMFVPQDEDKPS